MRRILGGLGAGVAWSGVAAAHPIHQHLVDLAALPDSTMIAPDWAPEILNPQQNETLMLLAERMVPGSTEAKVNRTIDLLLGADSPENRRRFADSLSEVDNESKKRFGRVFKSLSFAQQDELLTQLSTVKTSNEPDPGGRAFTPRDHFENLKGWIVGTYYSSEMGMRELGWTDEQYFDELPSCPHPEGHH